MECYLVVGWREFGASIVFGVYDSREDAFARSMAVNGDPEASAVCVIIPVEKNSDVAVEV